MNNILRLLLFFLIITSCSLDKKSGLWSKPEKIDIAKDVITKELFKEEESLKEEFNSNVRLQIKSKLSNNNNSNNLSNNSGRVNYDGNLKNISRYKFSKIDNTTVRPL